MILVGGPFRAILDALHHGVLEILRVSLSQLGLPPILVVHANVLRIKRARLRVKPRTGLLSWPQLLNTSLSLFGDNFDSSGNVHGRGSPGRFSSGKNFASILGERVGLVVFRGEV